MRESRTYGSVRGARSNARPYRDEIPDGRAPWRVAWIRRQENLGSPLALIHQADSLGL